MFYTTSFLNAPPKKYHSGCGEGYDCLYIKLSVQMVSPQVLFELFQKSTHVLFLTKEQSESSFLYSLNPLLFKREIIACHPVLSKMVNGGAWTEA